jgi:glycosyltransferase involved in cell wall biosynthesis
MTAPVVVHGQRLVGVDVSVVTPTVNRIALLERAMASVQAQEDLRVQHVIVGDDCPALAQPGVAARLVRDYPRTIVVVRSGCAPGVSYRPARTSFARNIGIGMASGQFIAHLDDDNEYEPDHLTSLLDALRKDPSASVAYSWRRLLTPSGSELDFRGLNPWLQDEVVSRQFFLAQQSFRIVSDGSSVMRDIPVGLDGDVHIDSSELLVPAAVHARLAFRTSYTQQEMAAGLCEDRAFCIDALAMGL